MNEKDIFKALGEVDPKFISESAPSGSNAKRKGAPWIRLVAACVALFVLATVATLMIFNTEDDGDSDALKYITYEELLSKEYTYYSNDFIYTKLNVSVDSRPVGSWTRTNYLLTKPQESGTKMKISGILKAKETTSYGSLSSGLAYMPGFTQKYLAQISDDLFRENFYFCA